MVCTPLDFSGFNPKFFIIILCTCHFSLCCDSVQDMKQFKRETVYFGSKFRGMLLIMVRKDHESRASVCTPWCQAGSSKGNSLFIPSGAPAHEVLPPMFGVSLSSLNLSNSIYKDIPRGIPSRWCQVLLTLNSLCGSLGFSILRILSFSPPKTADV